MEFIRISSYGNESKSSNNLQAIDLTLPNLADKNVLIVEDIIDTGLTLSEVVKVFKERKIASYEMVTLVDKPEGRKIGGVNPKYIGFNIPNKFVVGFGLDYNEIYRNLPYIGVLKRSVYEK